MKRKRLYLSQQQQTTKTLTMTLTFGKFKGQLLKNTPSYYQQWLSKQQWFNATAVKTPLHKQLNGWNGYSQRGEAIYDAIFEQEIKMAAKDDCRRGICTCCEDSRYYGMEY